MKHQLRDWVESRMEGLGDRFDEAELERKLNADLLRAGLFCNDGPPGQRDCPEWTKLGFLEEIRFHRSGVFVIFQTGVGIDCGYDDSAYIYSWSDKGWRCVWENEQNDYLEQKYKPQTLHAVQVSPYSRSNDYLVLTLGSEPWCSSNWHDVYYHVFRLGPDAKAPPLLDDRDWAFLSGEPPIQGSVTRNDVLIEYRVQGGAHNRPAVRHYEISGSDVKRVAPLALSPRDFVDEWLTQDWSEASHWSESEHHRPMGEYHKGLHKDRVAGEFIYPTKHCQSHPDVWQVGVESGKQRTYFLVRWRPPYRFSTVAVSDTPSPACTEEDREADDQERTLFPSQQ